MTDPVPSKDQLRHALDVVRAAHEPAAEPSAAFRELVAIAKAAERVCAFDWSDNDEDAVATIDRLGDAVAAWVRRRGAAQPPGVDG